MLTIARRFAVDTRKETSPARFVGVRLLLRNRGPPFAEELDLLADLHDHGKLTNEEFAEQR